MISNRKVFSAANIQQRPLDFWLVTAPCFSFTEKLWRVVRWASPFFADAFRPFSVTAFLATWQAASALHFFSNCSSSSFVILSLMFIPLSLESGEIAHAFSLVLHMISKAP